MAQLQKDNETFEAVVKELDTDHFTYHDAGVVGCLDMVSSWTSLAGQYGGPRHHMDLG